jgi:hypothetical protein
MQVPYRKTFEPDSADREYWKKLREHFRVEAERAYSIPEALELIRSERWEWPGELYKRPQGIGLRK